jgi:hypothetical protein
MHEGWNEVCEGFTGTCARLDHEVVAIGQSVCNSLCHLYLAITRLSTDCRDGGIEGCAYLGGKVTHSLNLTCLPIVGNVVEISTTSAILWI